jgi:triphosphoribosyl-dephospho-CoA synthetase
MEKFFIMGHDTANITPEQVLTMLRPVGMACETDMLEATGGVNTHRGAIFAFGLLSAAAGRLVARGSRLNSTGFAIRWPASAAGWSGASSPLKE